MLHYLGNKVDIELPLSAINRRNKMKQWKYGYNEEIDTVIISKDGTLGDIYNVQGLNIGFPEKPKDKDILNHNKLEKLQKWERHEMPSGLNAETMGLSKYSEYIDREFDRRENGVWIYIKGEAVYIPGTYYYGLQWIREEIDYPNFRMIQNEFMIYWEACKADDRCYGVQYIKNRRMGASYMAIIELLDSGTITEDKLLGIISKTGGDSSKIFRRLVKAFKRLPCFFMPPWDGTNTPKKELVLDEPTKRKSSNYQVTEGDGLGTTISWHNTAINAMDGDAIYRSLLDESSKYPKDVPFSDYWYIVKTSHTRGVRITGKSMVVSTVNAMKKGGSEYKKIYDDSNLEKRDDNGETKSGLYRIFIPARYCMEGMFDEYGYSIVEDPDKPIRTDEGKMVRIGTKTYLKNKLQNLQSDPDKYNEFLRQFPDTIKDAFRDESDECEFNLIKLQEQIEHNTFELNDMWNNSDDFIGNDDVERGNLRWANGIQDTEVVWEPDPKKGRFFIKKGCHPPNEFKNKYDNVFRNGTYANSPLASHIGCFGVDPYNRSKNADGRGSKGCIILSTNKSHTCDELPNGKMILEYIARPKKVEFFFEDVIMVSVYYSMPFLSELSNERFLAYIKDRGYRHFSANNPFKLYKDLNPTEKEFGGAPQQDTKIGDQQFYAVEAFVEDNIGVARDSSKRMKGEMGDMPFSRTLLQLKDVDTSNRTKYDAYIGFSLSLLGNQRRIKTTEVKTEPMNIPFQKYDNSGLRSKSA